MYIENKNGEIDGHQARIGWVTFSKSGLSIYYRDRLFCRLSGGGTGSGGNYYCEDSGDEYWISGIKQNGNNTHIFEPVKVHIDHDARPEYNKIKSTNIK